MRDTDRRQMVVDFGPGKSVCGGDDGVPMPQSATAQKAFHLLSTLVGERLEDHAHQMLTSVDRDPSTLLADLRELSDDMARLMAAMQTLNRLADWTSAL